MYSFDLPFFTLVAFRVNGGGAEHPYPKLDQVPPPDDLLPIVLLIDCVID